MRSCDTTATGGRPSTMGRSRGPLVTNTRPEVVPVASVVTGLKPEPNVIVRLVAPEVRTMIWRSEPAAGTVVV